MRKAVEAVLKTRAYADLSWRIVSDLSEAMRGKDVLHPLLMNRKEVKKTGLFLSAPTAACAAVLTRLFSIR